MASDNCIGGISITGCYTDDSGRQHPDLLLIEVNGERILYRKSLTKAYCPESLVCNGILDYTNADYVVIVGQQLHPLDFTVINFNRRVTIEEDPAAGFSCETIEAVLRECCPECVGDTPQDTVNKV